jgi:hypothetical protein
MILNLDHSVNAYGEHFLPRVLVRSANNPSKNKMEFEEGKAVVLTLSDILR